MGEKFLVLEWGGEEEARSSQGWGRVVGPGPRDLPPSSQELWSLVIRGCLMVTDSETAGWEASWGPGGLDCGFISISQDRLSQT